MVSDTQKAAIKASWSGIDKQAAGTALCLLLKDRAPEVYDIFNVGHDPKGIKAQELGLKVMEFIGVCVKNIDNMDIVKEKLEALAQLHINNGSMKKHFVPTGPCFLDSLAKVQGAKFTADARAAWAALYEIIAAGISAHLK